MGVAELVLLKFGLLSQVWWVRFAGSELAEPGLHGKFYWVMFGL